MDDVTFKNLHCLIADDDPMILLGLEEMLHELGIANVLRAGTGAKALAKLESLSRPIDCVLCDLNMPDGNGLQVLKAIRTGKIRYSRMDTCFIMVTGIAEQSAIETAAKLDANGYLVKPVVPEKLKSAIIRGRQRHFPISLARYQAVPVPHSQ
jgi:CheY-like chemotaxis protein